MSWTWLLDSEIASIKFLALKPSEGISDMFNFDFQILRKCEMSSWSGTMLIFFNCQLFGVLIQSLFYVCLSLRIWCSWLFASIQVEFASPCLWSPLMASTDVLLQVYTNYELKCHDIASGSCQLAPRCVQMLQDISAFVKMSHDVFGLVELLKLKCWQVFVRIKCFKCFKLFWFQVLSFIAIWNCILHDCTRQDASSCFSVLICEESMPFVCLQRGILRFNISDGTKLFDNAFTLWHPSPHRNQVDGITWFV